MSFFTTSLIPASTGLIALGAVLTTGGGASAQDFDGITPVEADRWMYPFNATPGVRPGGSVFGYCPFPQDEQVDNRDGQIVVAFDTTGIVPEGQGANRYQVDALVLEITLSGPASGPLDITSDAWQTYLPERPSSTRPMRMRAVRSRCSQRGFGSTTPGRPGPRTRRSR